MSAKKPTKKQIAEMIAKAAEDEEARRARLQHATRPNQLSASRLQTIKRDLRSIK